MNTTSVPKTHNPMTSHEKNIRQTKKLRDILQNTWPVLIKTVKVIENKERLRNCNRPEN